MNQSLNSAQPTYPLAWGKELHRNSSGRAFWYVSRFVARDEVEYVEALDGGAQCFRRERDADSAQARALAAEEVAA